MNLRRKLRRRKKVVVAAVVMAVITAVVVVTCAVILSPLSWIRLTIYADSMEVSIYIDGEITSYQIVDGVYHHTYSVHPGEHSVIVKEHESGEFLPRFMKFFKTSILETEVVTFGSSGY